MNTPDGEKRIPLVRVPIRKITRPATIAAIAFFGFSVYGLGLSLGATRYLELPYVVAPGIVLGAFVFSAVVGIVFGFLPARKAARLNPIEALRHE